MPAAPSPVEFSLEKASTDMEVISALHHPEEAKEPTVEDGVAADLTAAEAAAEPAEALTAMPIAGMVALSRSRDLSNDHVEQQSNEAGNVAAGSVKDQASHEEKASQSKGELRRGRRPNPKARAMAELELVNSDVQKALERVRMQLRTDAASIEERAAQKVAATAAVEAANSMLRTVGADVLAAMDLESQAGDRVKAAQKRVRETKQTVEEKKADLQSCKEMLIIVELKVSTRDAKRQKLAELERAVADCEKAQEEIRKQEREAKEAMRQFMKENKQMSKLGAFGRRHREKMLAGTHAEEVQESETVTTTAERADDGKEIMRQPVLPTAVSADQSASDGVVHIKREVMQAFSRPRNPALLESVVIIDED